ncbi:aminotransferase class V-fold PLP-dependent enzyme [Streptomyces sp. HUCO-GS316]|uniref:cysteine desulfurase family protein n=1 Tax=Streptomyces sp. HUCO-GS316 TaxID=2692198 RepID=UPI00136D1914|nr:cysteine desulfurase family protein [Streptomyces sp. HUCO-GS316]MXM62122.1 aminotransferase class V-fold PLP-dependent enzyme [Streptomyces sp. HUCO-GS316]
MNGPNGSDTSYLDYNATAPIRPEAAAAVIEAMQSVGNASSMHRPGRQAAYRVDVARQQLADLLNCSPGEIIFTSGATEANNLALRAAYTAGNPLVTTPVEHPAVLETARTVTAEQPDDLVLLPVGTDGLVDLGALDQVFAARHGGVVSLMAANNETGVLTDLRVAAKAACEAGALVHTDATQIIGRLPVDVAELDVDLLSLSAHKFGGPQGVGALYVRRGAPLPHRPLLVGGGQERGWRAGTLNVAGIIGMGAAAMAAHRGLIEEAERIASLRDRLELLLARDLPRCRFNGRRDQRLPGVTSVTFPGVPADAVLAAMPDVAASEGSACASGAPTPSHVLLAMGLSREDADSTIRFSLGYATTAAEVEHAAQAVVRAVTQVRSALAEAHGPR